MVLNNSNTTSELSIEQAQQPYMHGRISRVEAELRLQFAGAADGLFLVRTKTEGSLYALSICQSKQVKHFILERDGDSFMLSKCAIANCRDVDEAVSRIAAKSGLTDFPVPFMSKACLVSRQNPTSVPGGIGMKKKSSFAELFGSHAPQPLLPSPSRWGLFKRSSRPSISIETTLPATPESAWY